MDAEYRSAREGRLRIALFSGNYNYLKEGANQALNRLVRYLEEEAGHTVRVYSPVTDTPAFEPAGTLIPVPSVQLPFRREFQLALRLDDATKADIRAFAPDLVHVSTPDILGFRAQAFARELGRPIVASLHTRFEDYPAYYGLGWTKPLIEIPLRRFYRAADHVLVPTSALARDMMATRGDDRVRVWSRGVDRTLFDPARRDFAWRRQWGWVDDDVAILFFGRLVAEKEVATFVSVVERLQRRHASLRVLVVGAGPAARQFERLRAPVMTGHLQEADLARAVASADILLNPSTTETFGNVVLEAMAAGLPVVGADVASTAALVSHDISGMLCTPGDTDAYISAVDALIASPPRRIAMGEAARAASADYSWTAASRAVEQSYRDARARI